MREGKKRGMEWRRKKGNERERGDEIKVGDTIPDVLRYSLWITQLLQCDLRHMQELHVGREVMIFSVW